MPIKNTVATIFPMTLLALVLLSLSFANIQLRPAQASDFELAQKKANSGGPVRKLVFPAEFSLGRLYVYKDQIDPRHYPGSKTIAEQLGRFVGEAKGTVQFNCPEGGVVYLIASYQLTEKPQALEKLNPDAIDCLSFANVGIMADVKQAIKPISHLTGLRNLDLSVSELTDASLSSLKSLTRLENLNLFMSGINGTGLKDLTSLKKLFELEVTSNMLEPVAFTYISQMQNLQFLHASRCGVKDADMEQICKLQNLKFLGLAQAHITSKGLACIKRMKSLQFLTLTNAKLTVRDLLVLKGTHLKSINLPEMEYTPSDLTLIKNALPGTKLVFKTGKVGAYERTMYGPLH